MLTKLSGSLATIFAGLAMVNTAYGNDKLKTPIKHMIVVIGENATFDTLFAAYLVDICPNFSRNLGTVTSDDSSN